MNYVKLKVKKNKKCLKSGFCFSIFWNWIPRIHYFETNPDQKPKSKQSFSSFHWNLDSILDPNYFEISLLTHIA